MTKKNLGCRLWISSIALFWGIAWPQIGCQIRGDSQGVMMIHSKLFLMQATEAQYYVKFQKWNVKNHESQAQRRGQYAK